MPRSPHFRDPPHLIQARFVRQELLALVQLLRSGHQVPRSTIVEQLRAQADRMVFEDYAVEKRARAAQIHATQEAMRKQERRLKRAAMKTKRR